ncbi:MAG: proton-conducting membrane transporter [Actinomycetota bacterium]|nr:proton-conducting membrane transporter [Actinomycetota bacterium]
MSLAEHEQRHGQLPWSLFTGVPGCTRLVELTVEAGLRGRGGGGFPTAQKIAAVLAATSKRRPATVVANGCEGDSTSAKDVALLRHAPHLVLDGLALAAHALGATQAVLCVHRGSPVIPTLREALAERSNDSTLIQLATVPRRYVSSEASALARFLTDGDARPTSSQPHTATQGVQGRPTLVDNVETLAHLALIARHGADWFRQRGTDQSPGTTLITVGGAVNHAGVFEVDLGTHIGAILTIAGGASRPTEAMLLGGLSGRWLASTPNLDTPLCYEGHQGVRLGLPSVVVLPADVCGLAVTSTILTYLAGESAGQCGPCTSGLPAIAADFAMLATARPDATLRERLRRRLRVIPGRGACSHPDGAAQLATSALDIFSSDVAAHLTGRHCGRSPGSTLTLVRTLPAPAGGWI